MFVHFHSCSCILFVFNVFSCASISIESSRIKKEVNFVLKNGCRIRNTVLTYFGSVYVKSGKKMLGHLPAAVISQIVETSKPAMFPNISSLQQLYFNFALNYLIAKTTSQSRLTQ